MIERGEYNGRPTIILKRSQDDPYPFVFGMAKARLILENLEEITSFVKENEPGQKAAEDASGTASPPAQKAIHYNGIPDLPAFRGMDDARIAKLLALKAYCIGCLERDTFILEADIAIAKAEVEGPSADRSPGMLMHRQFFSIVLAELARDSDPLPYREKAAGIGEEIERLNKPSQLPHYLRIIDYVTDKITTADFGDFTTEHTAAHEDYIDDLASSCLGLKTYALSDSAKKFLFIDTLPDLKRMCGLAEDK